MSSQEEGLFGDFLENLAIFINAKAFGGRKSAAEGIDLEFTRDAIDYIVAIKSGPNWGNSQQIKRMRQNFLQAKRIKRTNNKTGNRTVAVNGCCYGIENQPDKNDYYKYCGQVFWEFISGDENLYFEIIKPLGHKAKEKNEDFAAAYAKIINSFTAEFTDEFCVAGTIDWQKLLVFNSGKKH